MITIVDTQTDAEIFALACRENTGSHVLDSGGAYGRHHEKPALNLGSPDITLEVYGRGTEFLPQRDPEVVATIETAKFLTEKFDILRELHSEFETWQDERDGDWFELASDFMLEKGYQSAAKDNVYNRENDLSQVYVWEVFQSSENKNKDWIYDAEAVVVIWVHTGCDVRSGYGSPLFCRSSGSDYAVPMDYVAGWLITEGTNSDGNPLSPDECLSLCERWQPGYSTNPAGQFTEEIERILYHSETRIRVLLKTGETVVVIPVMPY